MQPRCSNDVSPALCCTSVITSASCHHLELGAAESNKTLQGQNAMCQEDYLLTPLLLNNTFSTTIYQSLLD